MFDVRSSTFDVEGFSTIEPNLKFDVRSSKFDVEGFSTSDLERRTPNVF